MAFQPYACDDRSLSILGLWINFKMTFNCRWARINCKPVRSALSVRFLPSLTGRFWSIQSFSEDENLIKTILQPSRGFTVA
jgi:hypothetical protein